jgi:hypothetical protein
VGTPLWQSIDFGGKPGAGAQLFAYLPLRKRDFYVGGALDDITRGRPSTYFTFGFLKRGFVARRCRFIA